MSPELNTRDVYWEVIRLVKDIYRSLSPGIVSDLVRPGPDHLGIVDENLINPVHLPPGDVQRWIAVKLRGYLFVQLVQGGCHVR